MIQTFAFKVLQECSSWASRNGAVQMFFLTPNRNMFAGKFVNWESFLAVFWEHIIFNFKRVEIRKMSEVFWAKLYCKMSDLFRWFLLALRFSAANTGIKKLMMSIGICGNNIFKKRITNMRFWIIYILVQVSLLGTALGCFSQFLFFCQPTMMAEIFTQPPHHKKASYGPVNNDITVKIMNFLHLKTLSNQICVRLWSMFNLIFKVEKRFTI